jgi:hypothetical protein
MYTNVNLAAPVGVLALLGTAFLLMFFVLATLYAAIRRRRRFAKFSIGGFVGIAGIYLAVLLAFSFISTNKVLGVREEKHFCELDCHLAYSIVSVEKSKTINIGGAENIASGVYYRITLKTRFDETTINPQRGNGPLFPNPRSITITDEQGRTFVPATQIETALAAANAAGTNIATPLRPAESYTTVVVFDLPADVQKPELLVNESDWITRFIIGHENSPLHSKARFQL